MERSIPKRTSDNRRCEFEVTIDSLKEAQGLLFPLEVVGYKADMSELLWENFHWERLGLSGKAEMNDRYARYRGTVCAAFSEGYRLGKEHCARNICWR